MAHCAGPKNIPSATPVRVLKDGKLRNFKAANDTKIENFGVADVVMEQEDGAAIGNQLHVADVSRILHSTSVICDTASKRCPDGHEVLTTKTCSIVVPDGTFSRYLNSVCYVAKYPRRGGLYVAKMRFGCPSPELLLNPRVLAGRVLADSAEVHGLSKDS